MHPRKLRLSPSPSRGSLRSCKRNAIQGKRLFCLENEFSFSLVFFFGKNIFSIWCPLDSVISLSKYFGIRYFVPNNVRPHLCYAMSAACIACVLCLFISCYIIVSYFMPIYFLLCNSSVFYMHSTCSILFPISFFHSLVAAVAPLSGPLVIAEALGDRRRLRHSASASSSRASSSSSSSTSSAHKDKDKDKTSSSKKKKKDKYVLKRRDEHPAAASSSSPSLPDAFFAQKQHDSSFIVKDATSAAAAAAGSDYVLQKREQAAEVKPDDDRRMPDAESPQTLPLPSTMEISVDDIPAAVPLVNSGSALKAEKKNRKRPTEDVNHQDGTETKKKKKKDKKHRDGLGQDLFKKTAAEGGRAPVAPTTRRESPPTVDLGSPDQLELRGVFTDLKSIALDPFYGIERNVPLLTRHAFSRYRSLVYKKSLVTDESDGEGSEEVQPIKPAAAASIAPLASKEAKTPPPPPQQHQQREQGSSSVKPAKLLKRPDDPTKASRKRAPSDRQEEISAKRMKKVNRLKSLASEKKTALNKKTPTDGLKSSSGAEPALTVPIPAGPSAAEPAKKLEKQELPAPRRESPTFLIMRFPPRSTLPSIANLKARFARFGSLEVDSTRVFWKSHTCRVQFKHKSDALKALGYCRSNDIFGQIRVEYSIREIEAPAPELPAELPRRPQADGKLQFRRGSSNGSSPGAVPPRSQMLQGKLKSILKKPGDDAGKDSQRVKFMLSGNGDSSKADSPPSASAKGVTFADVAPAQPLPALIPTSFQLPPPLSVSQPCQTLPQAQPPLPPPVQSLEPHMPLLPHRLLRPVDDRAPPHVQFNEPQIPREEGPRHGDGGSGMEGMNRDNGDNVDISHKMLSLLLRCNDIVAELRALPGFVAYRPL